MLRPYVTYRPVRFRHFLYYKHNKSTTLLSLSVQQTFFRPLHSTVPNIPLFCLYLGRRLSPRLIQTSIGHLYTRFRNIAPVIITQLQRIVISVSPLVEEDVTQLYHVVPTSPPSCETMFRDTYSFVHLSSKRCNFFSWSNMHPSCFPRPSAVDYLDINCRSFATFAYIFDTSLQNAAAISSNAPILFSTAVSRWHFDINRRYFATFAFQ